MPTDAKTGTHTRANRSVMVVDGKLPADPPTGLTKEARAAWSMAISCAPQGLLTALDHSVLESWARNYALYRKLASQVDHEGATIEDAHGTPIINPAANLLIKVQASLRVCEKALGFSPASRARVRAPEAPEKDNDFEDF